MDVCMYTYTYVCTHAHTQERNFYIIGSKSASMHIVCSASYKCLHACAHARTHKHTQETNVYRIGSSSASASKEGFRVTPVGLEYRV